MILMRSQDIYFCDASTLFRQSFMKILKEERESEKRGVINCFAPRFAQDNIKFHFAWNKKLIVCMKGGPSVMKKFFAVRCFESQPGSSFHRQQKRDRKQKCINYRRPLFRAVNMNYCLPSLNWRESFILAFTSFTSQRGDDRCDTLRFLNDK